MQFSRVMDTNMKKRSNFKTDSSRKDLVRQCPSILRLEIEILRLKFG